MQENKNICSDTSSKGPINSKSKGKVFAITVITSHFFLEFRQCNQLRKNKIFNLEKENTHTVLFSHYIIICTENTKSSIQTSNTNNKNLIRCLITKILQNHCTSIQLPNILKTPIIYLRNYKNDQYFHQNLFNSR